MSIESIYSTEVYTSQAYGAQQASVTQTQNESKAASRDTYVPEEQTETASAGIYSVTTDENGARAISFDAPAQAGVGAQMAGNNAAGASSSSSSSDDTDDLEDELEDLEDQRDDLEQQLKATQDEQEQQKIQKQIDQLDTQIQLKQSEIYSSESESEE